MNPASESSPLPLRVARSRFRPWRELTLLALLVMILSWVTPWYLALAPESPSTTARVFLTLGGIAGGVHVIVRLMNALQLKVSLRRAILLGSLLVGLYVGYERLLYSGEALTLGELIVRPLAALADLQVFLPNEFLVSAAVLFVSWQALVLAQEYLGPGLARRHFQVGTLMFLVLIFLFSLQPEAAPGATLYLFIFAGLTGMGAARVSVLSAHRGGRRNPFDRDWVFGMLLASLGVIGLAVGVAAMVTGSVSLIVRVLLVIVIGVVALVTLPFLLLMLYALDWLFSVFELEGQILLDSLRAGLDRLLALFQQLADLLGDAFGFLGVFGAWLAGVAPALKFVFCLSVILVAFLGIVLSLRNRERRTLDPWEEERESVYEQGDVRRNLRKSLADRFQDLLDRMAGRGILGRRMQAAARIRRIYGQLMDLCARLDRPRPEAMTPIEFQRTLRAIFPRHPDEIAVITQAYVRVRYGELPEGPQDIQQVEAAWRSIAAEGKARLKT